MDMQDMLNKIAQAIYAYGQAGANMASCRGTYEMPVPAELREQEEA